MRTVDLTPSWGEWGNLFYRFALEGKRSSLEALHPDMAKAFAAAAAFVAIQGSLTDEQRLQANAVLEAEMRKQGVA
ncbi:hypothetical protein [Nitratidesulfovibrio liaohensis]|uniref:Uncharacterized protein n=1 Tax=Nitratidesulfovibrio liaohensis TaxID=2604158 RepID=A0ABY9R4D6_9BACT|nr:hypothetical protein [Nitratidesulfovibrio liaohensis]WMW66626.1 hypothetical protein KPS_001228 [Nitratidesulfovibrio liaohensis]